MVHFVRIIYSVLTTISTVEDIEKNMTLKRSANVPRYVSTIPMRDTKMKMVSINQSDFKVASKARDTLSILGTRGNYQDKFQDRNLCTRG